MTAWKATAIPSQPVQSCGLALARFSGSTVSPPVRTTCTSARWKACPSTVGDASTRWLGPPATAGAARQRSTTRAERAAGITRGLEAHADGGQRGRGRSPGLGHEPEQQVPGVDLDMVECPRRGPRGPDGPAPLGGDEDLLVDLLAPRSRRLGQALG